MSAPLRLSFVRGHCGWDVVTLLLGSEIPAGRELEIAQRVLDVPFDGGIESGILDPGDAPGDVRLRITDLLTRDWLPMCGGMSQVIGKALVETSLREHFRIDPAAAVVRVRLQTGRCDIPVAVEVTDGKATRVTTTMDSYAAHAYATGVEHVSFAGVRATRVAEFLVIDLANLEAVHPGVDFTRRDPGPHLAIVNGVLEAYRRQLGGVPGVVSMLYDARPEGPGDLRAFPRFYGADDTASRMRYEFQCGTGTVAIAVALAHARRLPGTGRDRSFLLEWGSQRTTPDPYGIRTSRVELALEGERVTRIDFEHSVIEILAEGTLQVGEAV